MSEPVCVCVREKELVGVRMILRNERSKSNHTTWRDSYRKVGGGKGSGAGGEGKGEDKLHCLRFMHLLICFLDSRK